MRIMGVTIPDEKRLEIGLTSLFGVGRSRARKILDDAGIGYEKKPSQLNGEEENNIKGAIEKYRVEGDLKREVSGNIKRLKDIKSYRGTRHTKGLPSRGQRTKVNSRTVRGNVRRTMGSGRRKVDKK